MAQNIVIISGGKFAREVYTITNHVIAAGKPWRIKGFLDDRKDILNGFNYPVGIIGSVEGYEPQADDLFVCGIGDPAQKKQFCEKILAKGGKFATLVHPTAVVAQNVVMGTGVIINTFATISADAVLGNFAHVGPYGVISHDNRIGDWCQLSPNCCLAGDVEVGELCFFGIQTAVVPGVRIGRRAFVGAGSVVVRNVKPGVKVFGNPAVKIGMVDDE